VNFQEICDDLNSRKGDGHDARPRTYIGASSIGDTCHAYQTFCMRGFPGNSPDVKLQRIFNIGHALEPLVINSLKDAGIHVMERDPMTGNQYRFTAYGDHFMANVDGIAEVDGEPWIVEVKTLMAKKWREMVKYGIKKSHPKYLAQVQACMGLSGYMKAMLVAINKDTAEIAIQVIDFDVIEWGAISARAEAVLKGSGVRESDDPESWGCRYCFKRDICWEPSKVSYKPQCSRCECSVPDILNRGGSWICTIGGGGESASPASVKATDVCGQFKAWTPPASEAPTHKVHKVNDLPF